MVQTSKTSWKSNYLHRFAPLFEDYDKFLIVDANNVGSKQLAQIRMSLRGKAVVLMGKNTLMRKAILGHLSQNPKLEILLPHIVGNVGLVFTKEELVDIRDLLLENKVTSFAKAGAIAPVDVIIPSQNTGLGPEKTPLFQMVNIPTRISRGKVEITQDIKLIKEGDKVTPSDSMLLNLLGISPFSYALVAKKAYECGTVFAMAAPVTVERAAEQKKEEQFEEPEEEESDEEALGLGLFD